MKNIKRLIIIIVLIIGIRNVYALPKFDNTIKVYDYAQILTEKEENKLKEKVDKYINKYNMDMVLVTVKYYEQSKTIDYINIFYNKYRFKKDGIMVVIDLKTNNIGINTFGRSINYYSENEINNIINIMNNEKDYYDKFNEFIKYSEKYINEFETIIPIAEKSFTILNILWMLIPSFIVPTIVIVIGIIKNKNIKKAHTANYYIVNSSIVINKKEDKYVTTNTTKTRINNK